MGILDRNATEIDRTTSTCWDRSILGMNFGLLDFEDYELAALAAAASTTWTRYGIVTTHLNVRSASQVGPGADEEPVSTPAQELVLDGFQILKSYAVFVFRA